MAVGQCGLRVAKIASGYTNGDAAGAAARFPLAGQREASLRLRGGSPANSFILRVTSESPRNPSALARFASPVPCPPQSNSIPPAPPLTPPINPNSPTVPLDPASNTNYHHHLCVVVVGIGPRRVKASRDQNVEMRSYFLLDLFVNFV